MMIVQSFIKTHERVQKLSRGKNTAYGDTVGYACLFLYSTKEAVFISGVHFHTYSHGKILMCAYLNVMQKAAH
jgi:hypothetical protein